MMLSRSGEWGRSLRAAAWATGTAILIAALTLPALRPWRVNEAGRIAVGASSPAIQDPTAVVIDPPEVGATVLIEAGPAAISGTITTIQARNVTLDGTGPANWIDGDMRDDTGYVQLLAAGGDLVELKVVDDATGESAEALVGYVPLPSDVARPFFASSLIVIASTDPEFRISVLQKAVQDNSFPATLELTVSGETVTSQATLTSTNGAYNTSTALLSVTAPAAGAFLGKRARLTATDAYGNRTELHFDIGSTQPSVGFNPFPGNYRASTAHSDGERTGISPQVAGVFLKDGDFATSLPVYSLRGRARTLDLSLNYRSSITTSGNLGYSWDWEVDSRLSTTASLFKWYPGDGRREDGLQIGDSPPGLFLDLSFDSSTKEYSLSAADGSRLIFEEKSGLLVRSEDAFHNSITFVRDQLGRATEIIDDIGRKVAVFWHHKGQLAAIVDFGGRRTEFGYDAAGNLTTIRYPDETQQLLEYATGNLLARMYEPLPDSVTNPPVLLENTYDSAHRVTGQRHQHNALSTEPATTFSYVSAPAGLSQANVVVVTDPAGASTAYAIEDNQPHALLWVDQRSDLDLRAPGSGFPWSIDDPAAWRQSLVYDPDTLLVVEKQTDVIGAYLTTSPFVPDPGQLTAQVAHESWQLHSPQESNPLLRARVANHQRYDGTSGIEESWTYDPDEAPFPSRHTDFRGTETSYERNAAGAITRSAVEGVSYAIAPGSYDIVHLTQYDQLGRVTAIWNANRIHAFGELCAPNTVYEYYDTGIATGYLKSETLQDHNGNNPLTTTYAYDQFGRVLVSTAPNGAMSNYEYDAAGRKTRQQGPLTTLTHPEASPGTAIRHTTEWTFVGSRVTKVETDNISAVGLVLSPPKTETSFEYDSRGRLTSTQNRLNTTESSNTTSVYDTRGHVVERWSQESSTSWSVQRFQYDSRGLLLRESSDPTHFSQVGTPETAAAVVSWYAYNHEGRVSHNYEPLRAVPIIYTYDGYGRKTAVQTPLVNLGTDLDGNQQYGRMRKEFQYDDAGSPILERDLSADATSAWLVTAETRFTYDLAGRRVGTHSAIPLAPPEPTTNPEQWADHYVDLFPSGQTWRTYRPFYVGPATVDASIFEESSLDDFDREIARTDYVGNRMETTYDTSTGWLVQSDDLPLDELNPTIEKRYRTLYSYDEQGRVVEKSFLGNVTPAPSVPPVTTRYAYDGLGRQVRTGRYEGSVEGVVTETAYDLAGRALRQRSGTGVPLWPQPVTGIAAETSQEYDLQGRVLEATQHGAPPRTTQYSYDAMGRVQVLTHPDRDLATPATTRQSVYTYELGGFRTLTTTDPNNVTLTYGYNELGQMLSTTVNGQQALVAHASDGTQEQQFCYGRLEPSLGGYFASQLPTSATTKGIDEVTGLVVNQTKVSRGYNAHGDMTYEEIGFPNCPVRTEFTYDRARRRTAVSYPRTGDLLTPATTVPGLFIQRVFRQDDLRRELWAWNEQQMDLVKLEDAHYAGMSTIRARSYSGAGTTAAPILLKTESTVLDARGLPQELTITDRLGNTVLRDVVTRNMDGLVTSQLQPNGNWSHTEYEGPHWIESEIWNSDSATNPRSGANYLERKYVRNGVGEVVTVSNVGPQLTANNLANVWNYVRDDAGFASATFAPNSESIEPQSLNFDFNRPIGQQILHRLHAREHWYDDRGNEYRQRYSYGTDVGTAFEANEGVTWQHTFDAWGRQTDSVKTTPISSTAIQRRYDAFGRLVWQRTESDDPSVVPMTVIHAYEDNQIIKSMTWDGTCVVGGALGDQHQENPDGQKNRARKDLFGGGTFAADVGFVSYAADLVGNVVVTNYDPQYIYTSRWHEPEVFQVREWYPWGEPVEARLESDPLYPPMQHLASATVSGSEYLAAYPQLAVFTGVLYQQAPHVAQQSVFFNERPEVPQDLLEAYDELNEELRAAEKAIEEAKRKHNENPTEETEEELDEKIREWREILASLFLVVKAIEELGGEAGQRGRLLEGLITKDLNGQLELTAGGIRPVPGEPEQTDEERLAEHKAKAGQTYLDTFAAALDVAGFIPGVGVIADVAGAGLALVRGNLVEAGINLVAALPGVGDAVKLTHLASVGLIVGKVATEGHHLLPQAKRFQNYFASAGLNIEDFVIPLDKAKHRLRPGGIHTNGGGNWNRVWDDFFRDNPDATRQEILDQMNRMRGDSGI